MKTYELTCAGFGGQGVLSLGQIVAYSAMFQGKNVTWLPSYGPEMRGGTANCSVVVSDEPIASPLITRPNALIAMNKPSLDKFVNKVEKDGYIFVNSSIIEEKVARTDVKVYYIPTLELATALGNAKGINVVMLGALVAATDIVSEERALEGIAHFFSNKPNMIEINKQMFAAGKDFLNKR